MGRKTWFNFPEKNRSFKDRINIIINRELKEPHRKLIFLPKEAMNKPGHLRLFVAKIMQEFERDTFFPENELENYKLLPEYPGVSSVQEEKITKYKFEV
ncbi:hypothetical protein FD755_010121 [Muntiacus reevesi]|uniref:dihydrofolate reductase n=1 Tax=Muntiacus reevesi TaxID=9886 RepID=A0A5N3XXQ2_MUNRE|nr:hypothetical protein FD755_010121 [Muntiacus reevesi]